MTGLQRVESLNLVANQSAVACARVFVAVVLRRWGLTALEVEANNVVAELVGQAVAVSGELALLGIRLVGMPASVGVEVWDGSERYPSAVPALGTQRGCYAAGGGWVQWVEIDF